MAHAMTIVRRSSRVPLTARERQRRIDSEAAHDRLKSSQDRAWARLTIETRKTKRGDDLLNRLADAVAQTLTSADLVGQTSEPINPSTSEGINFHDTQVPIPV